MHPPWIRHHSSFWKHLLAAKISRVLAKQLKSHCDHQSCVMIYRVVMYIHQFTCFCLKKACVFSKQSQSFPAATEWDFLGNNANTSRARILVPSDSARCACSRVEVVSVFGHDAVNGFGHGSLSGSSKLNSGRIWNQLSPTDAKRCWPAW